MADRWLRPRDALRKAIAAKIVGYADTMKMCDEAAEEVMKLFPLVAEEIDEQEVTTLRDTHEQMLWTRFVVAKWPAESGQYEGKPRQ